MFPIFHDALEQVFNTIIKTVANLIKILPCTCQMDGVPQENGNDF